MAELQWFGATVRDSPAAVVWTPAFPVSQHAHTFAGVTREGQWAVGRPQGHVLLADAPSGAIGLLPLVDRKLQEVRDDISATVALHGCHPLALQRMMDAALDERTSPHWAEKAIKWLESGFPTVWYLDALRRVAVDRRIQQHARQTAARLVAAQS